jgi:hypothetical protein
MYSTVVGMGQSRKVVGWGLVTSQIPNVHYPLYLFSPWFYMIGAPPWMIDLITSIGYVEGNKEKRTCFRRDKTATREHHSRQVTATPILSLKKEGTRVNEASELLLLYGQTSFPLPYSLGLTRYSL